MGFRTAQNIFTVSYNGLAAQGWKQSKSDSIPGENQGACAYRGDDGCKCAVGHLIPQKNYRQYLEGKGVADPDVRKAARIAADTGYTLASDLQSIHDMTPDPIKMEQKFRDIAKQYGLKVPRTKSPLAA